MRSRIVLWGAYRRDVQAGSRTDWVQANPGGWISLERIAEEYRKLGGDLAESQLAKALGR